MTEHAWQRYDGITYSDGSVAVECGTNDNDDDGFPDREGPQYWHIIVPNVAAFKKFAGTSRIGVSGIRVTVTLDGKPV